MGGLLGYLEKGFALGLHHLDHLHFSYFVLRCSLIGIVLLVLDSKLLELWHFLDQQSYLGWLPLSFSFLPWQLLLLLATFPQLTNFWPLLPFFG